jgi:hypothetical protein
MQTIAKEKRKEKNGIKSCEKHILELFRID